MSAEAKYETVVFFLVKVIALTVALFVCFVLASAVLGDQGNAQTSSDAGSAVITLLAVCCLNTLVLISVIVRSRWTGWRLIAAIFLVYFGVTTFMSQIESAVFITRLPPGILPRLFLMGALIAAPFSVLAVSILGKLRARTVDTENNQRLIMPASEWSWKLGVIAIAYVILYFTFGYYIAWRNPAVREYYNGTDPGSFFAQFGNVLRDTPWLVPFQVLRAMLWTLIALPVVRMMKGSRPETALAIALLFSVVMNSQLLLPNPYMPDAVRMAHLVETALSNFIFGFLIGWLLSRRRKLI